MELIIDRIAVTAPGRKTILRDVSCRFVGPGVHCVLGPSGSGKTTLLRVINRLADEAPGLFVEGRVFLDGRDVRARGVDSEAIRQRICLIQQRPAVFPGTVLDNAEFALRHCRRGGGADERRRRAMGALEQVGLLDEVEVDMAASHLSGGQAQRLAIARAIVLDPDVLLMDEPTASLDPISAARIEGVCSRLGRERTVVIVTHDLSLTARVADQVTVIWPHAEGARVVESGPVRAVLHAPSSAQTRLLLDLASRGHLALGSDPDHPAAAADQSERRMLGLIELGLAR